MALPVNGSTHLIPAYYYSFVDPERMKGWLSWPRWLTCSGRFTHINGHPSAAGRAQDRESSPVRDRRSTTVPRYQLMQRILQQSDIPYQQVSCIRIDSCHCCILCPWNRPRRMSSGCIRRLRWVLQTPSFCTLTGYRRTSETLSCTVRSRIQYWACAHITNSQSVRVNIIACK